jgi:hypothetical protein
MKYYFQSKKRGISYMKYVNGRLTGLVTAEISVWKFEVNGRKISSTLPHLRATIMAVLRVRGTTCSLNHFT